MCKCGELTALAVPLGGGHVVFRRGVTWLPLGLTFWFPDLWWFPRSCEGGWSCLWSSLRWGLAGGSSVAGLWCAWACRCIHYRNAPPAPPSPAAATWDVLTALAELRSAVNEMRNDRLPPAPLPSRVNEGAGKSHDAQVCVSVYDFSGFAD